MSAPIEPEGRELAIDADLRDFANEAAAAGMTLEQLTEASLREAEAQFPAPPPGVPDEPEDKALRDAVSLLRSAFDHLKDSRP